MTDTILTIHAHSSHELFNTLGVIQGLNKAECLHMHQLYTVIDVDPTIKRHVYKTRLIPIPHRIVPCT